MSLEVLPQRRVRPESVEASLLFLEPSPRKPRVDVSYDAALLPATELYAPRRVRLQDARAVGASLDAEGFELQIHASKVDDFYDEDLATNVGRTEAAQLVSAATGAARVHVFDHTRRRRAPDATRQPSTRVHVDYTEASAPQRVRDLFGADADALLLRRFAFINVWRPIRHPAQDWPLALCDARSVEPGSLVATDLVYPDRRGEIYGLVYHAQQRWFYVPDMGLDEAVLIKCYDSREDVARFTPHTAFASPLTPPGAPARESIEFRTIAFFD
ncbi:MAG: CmcJ/NvfI family oxidoreductase [Vitreimonas sp.]